MIPAYLILHCSDTEDGPGLSAPAIRRYHVETLGWREVGYHYLLESVGLDDDKAYIVTPGRRPSEDGAHCRAGGRNYDSLGVCVVGRFDHAPPSKPLFVATCRFLAQLAFTFGIPSHRVQGHREYESAKTCPGLAWPLDETRTLVSRMLQVESEWGPHLRLDQMGGLL